MAGVIERLAERWCLPVGLLEDVYALLLNDPRFESAKEPYGMRYAAMSRRLKYVYRVEVNERQLKYLVKVVRRERRKRL